MRQLALPFAVDTGFAAADFVAGPNSAAARAWLEHTAAWPRGKLALYGNAGVGKSHLLHMWAERTGARIARGPALARDAAGEARAIAIDDADLANDERAFLHLLNGASEDHVPVLLAGRAAPGGWRVGLPDLGSRLRAIQAIAITAPDEATLAVIFARILSARQLVVRPEVQAWLLARLPRHPAALAEAAARLDRAALAAGRRIGWEIAADILGEPGVDEEKLRADPVRSSPTDPVLL